MDCVRTGLFTLAAVLAFFPFAWGATNIAERFEEEETGAFDGWRFGTEFGVLQRVGNNSTPLDYTLLAGSVSALTPIHAKRETGDGRFGLRGRFSLFGEAVVEGPETAFGALAAGPVVEWTPTGASWNLFFSAGGGAGWLDSRGDEIPGAQGQDFNFVWYLNAGTARKIGERWCVSLEVYFQHLSNGGLADVNPGLDAIGPRIGISRAF